MWEIGRGRTPNDGIFRDRQAQRHDKLSHHRAVSNQRTDWGKGSVLREISSSFHCVGRIPAGRGGRNIRIVRSQQDESGGSFGEFGLCCGIVVRTDFKVSLIKGSAATVAPPLQSIDIYTSRAKFADTVFFQAQRAAIGQPRASEASPWVADQLPTKPQRGALTLARPFGAWAAGKRQNPGRHVAAYAAPFCPGLA